MDTIDDLNNAKNKYNLALNKIANIITKLNGVDEKLNESSNFSGFDHVTNASNCVLDAIDRLNNTKSNLNSAISSCDEKIKQLEIEAEKRKKEKEENEKG